MAKCGKSKIISLGAGLTLATVVIGSGQATAAQGPASYAPTLADSGVSQAATTEEAPITFDALQERFDQLYFQGHVSRYAWSFGGGHLRIAEHQALSGHCSTFEVVRDSFSRHMAEFKALVSDPLHVPDESIRTELVDAADALMPLCLGDEAAG